MAAPAPSVDRHFADALDARFPVPGAASTKWVLGEVALKLVASRSPKQPGQNEVCKVVNPSHRAEKLSEDGMDNLARTAPQEFPAKPADARSLADQVREALTADFGNLKARRKEIARKAGGISPRTVERWDRGEGVPHLELFLELGKHSPALRAVAMRCWAMEADQDPAFQRELVAFLQSRVRR